METETTQIYGILDPRANRVFYVGRSNNPERRLAQHVTEARLVGTRIKRAQVIREILAAGLQPALIILETVSLMDAFRAELKWIREHSGEGLTNVWPDYPGWGKSYMRAEQMREIRQGQKITQAELAQRLGVHESAVSLWEAGKRKIPSPVAKLVWGMR